MMKSIDEIIVVEGRDDTAAVLRAVDAATIETHGYGIRPSTWEVIDKAYESKGIIIFTDPDTAGEQIRRRLSERYPDAKHAFLDRGLAEKDGDIGIEKRPLKKRAVLLLHRKTQRRRGKYSHPGTCSAGDLTERRERRSAGAWSATDWE